MALPLALPLAPVIGQGASAAAATFIAGSALALAETVYGFRRSTPTLPPLTGLDGVATLPELIADALAGARIPVALPPSPLGPNGSLGSIAAIGAAAGIWNALKNGGNQLWGLLNGPPRTPAVPGLDIQTLGNNVKVEGSFSATGQTNVYLSGEWHLVRLQFGECVRLVNGPNQNIAIDGSFQYANGLTGLVKASGGISTPCGGTNQASLSANTPGGVVPMLALSVDALTTNNGFDGTVTLSTTGPNPQPGAAKAESVWTSPTYFADISAGAAALPSLPPLPLVLPSVAPLPRAPNPEEPQTQPEIVPVQPGPARPAVPAVSPAKPRTIAPWLLPGAIPATQTRSDGSLVPTTAPPVVATNPGAVVPWPGAAAIPGTGLAPAPTLQGIAQEVGRIERKLEVMNTPNAPGNLIDKFDLLRDLIGPLVEAFLSSTSGTTYTMDSPCEVDAEGFKLPAVEVEAPGALTYFGLVLNRLDALAELLQVHKNLKQPNCRQKPPTGEFVTVNFEEID